MQLTATRSVSSPQSQKVLLEFHKSNTPKSRQISGRKSHCIKIWKLILLQK